MFRFLSHNCYLIFLIILLTALGEVVVRARRDQNDDLLVLFGTKNLSAGYQGNTRCSFFPSVCGPVAHFW